MAAPMKTMVEDDLEPWAPTYPEIDPITQQIVMKKMGRYINKLESSQFYHDFQDQLRSPPISEHLQKVLGSESKMEMVIYNVGKFELDEESRWQLSLAVLMKKDFEWIGDIKVFDSHLSGTECKILEAFDCSVLLFNEYGERKAIKPTMFFMPSYCDCTLYDNLLQANWTPHLLSNIVLLGGRLKTLDVHDMIHISTAKKFTHEFLIKHDHYEAFQNLSWHFFSPVVQTELLCIDDYALNGGGIESYNEVEILIGFTNLQVDLDREKALSQRLIRYMEKLERSNFYLVIREKLQNPPISELLHKILGESKMQIVIYHVGQLKDDVLLHLSLALLMKKDFEWIEDIEVYGGNVPTSARRVLKTLGCSVLSPGVCRMPQALKPTMFFLQDCPPEFYNNILKANWKSNLLSNMVVLCGNEFDECMQHLDSSSKSIDELNSRMLSSFVSRTMGHLIAAQTFTNEFKFKKLFDDHQTFQNSSCWEDYYDAFYHSTCHFLGPVSETTLQSINEVYWPNKKMK